MQHLAANAIREGIIGRGETIEQHLAVIDPDLPGLSYDRVTRMLRGETQMQLADIMFWSRQFARVRAVVEHELGRLE